MLSLGCPNLSWAQGFTHISVYLYIYPYRHGRVQSHTHKENKKRQDNTGWEPGAQNRSIDLYIHLGMAGPAPHAQGDKKQRKLTNGMRGRSSSRSIYPSRYGRVQTHLCERTPKNRRNTRGGSCSPLSLPLSLSLSAASDRLLAAGEQVGSGTTTSERRGRREGRRAPWP